VAQEITVLARYRAAFTPRGSLSFSLAGLLGRLPSSMVGLGLVLVVSARGDYGTAGSLVGVLALAGCVGGPLQGRLADRFGQARALVPAAAGFGVALAGLVLALRSGAPFAVLAVLAGVVGVASPTTGTLARSRWNALHPGGARLQTAFAVEAVFDEVVFVTGPVAATLLATRADPLYALVVAGVAGVAGSLLLAAQRRTEPPAERSSTTADGHRRSRTKLPVAALAPLLGVQLTVGIVFGSIDVTTVAAATAAGQRSYAGLILACFSGGSLLAGVVVGAVRWRLDPMTRVRVCVAVLGATTLLLPLVPTLSLLPVAGFAVGVTVSPALVALAAAMQVVTPRDRLTEAMAIGTSALIAGFSLGSALAGHLVDVVGAHRAFGQAAAAGLLAAACVLVPPLGRSVRTALRPRSSRAVRPAARTTSGESSTGPVTAAPAARSQEQVPASQGVGPSATRPNPDPAQPTGDEVRRAGDELRPAGDEVRLSAGRRALRSSVRLGGAVVGVRPTRGAAPGRTDAHGPGARRTGDPARRH